MNKSGFTYEQVIIYVRMNIHFQVSAKCRVIDINTLRCLTRPVTKSNENPAAFSLSLRAQVASYDVRGAEVILPVMDDPVIYFTEFNRNMSTLIIRVSILSF